MGSVASNDANEKIAYKVLVVRTKNSMGYLLVGANAHGGYYCSNKCVKFQSQNDEHIMGMVIWDTPAIDGGYHDKITTHYYKYANALLCVYNVESKTSFIDISQKIVAYLNPKTTPFQNDSNNVVIMLIGHKVPGFKETNRQVSFEMANVFANSHDVTFLEISSDNFQDRSDLFTILSKHLYHIHDVSHETLLTDEWIKKCDVYGFETYENNTTNNNNNNSNNNKSSETNNSSNNSDVKYEYNDDDDTSDSSQLKVKLQQETKKRKSRKSIERELDKDLNKRLQLKIKSKCGIQFVRFLYKRVQMPYLYERFNENNYCDIRMVQYFNDKMLKKEIGIKNEIHRKLFLNQCGILKNEVNEFKQRMKSIKMDRYLDQFEQNGIITINILCDEIKKMSDLKNKIKILNDKHCKIIWKEIENYLYDLTGNSPDNNNIEMKDNDMDTFNSEPISVRDITNIDSNDTTNNDIEFDDDLEGNGLNTTNITSIIGGASPSDDKKERSTSLQFQSISLDDI